MTEPIQISVNLAAVRELHQQYSNAQHDLYDLKLPGAAERYGVALLKLAQWIIPLVQTIEEQQQQIADLQRRVQAAELRAEYIRPPVQD
jgi:hypothetical protein